LTQVIVSRDPTTANSLSVTALGYSCHEKDFKEPNMADALGDRMKSYEARETDRRFLPTLPVYARIDGRGFSAFARGLDRPFDTRMTELMILTTEALVEETQARIGYTQSDEISLVWLAERADSSIFFDHRIAKMTSVLAAYATAAFTRALYEIPGLEP
jgi:tRNA(His) 5'-end guanylyltransferase